MPSNTIKNTAELKAANKNVRRPEALVKKRANEKETTYVARYMTALYGRSVKAGKIHG